MSLRRDWARNPQMIIVCRLVFDFNSEGSDEDLNSSRLAKKKMTKGDTNDPDKKEEEQKGEDP